MDRQTNKKLIIMELTNFTIKQSYLIKDLLKEGYIIKTYNGNKITLYLNKLEVTIEN